MTDKAFDPLDPQLWGASGEWLGGTRPRDILKAYLEELNRTDRAKEVARSVFGRLGSVRRDTGIHDTIRIFLLAAAAAQCMYEVTGQASDAGQVIRFVTGDQDAHAHMHYQHALLMMGAMAAHKTTP
jgi:hypothetical protein